MDDGVAFPADAQAAEVVQPGEGALDHPAPAAEPGAVLGLAAGDDGLDAAAPQLAAVLVVVVAAVGDDPIGALVKSARWTAPWRVRVEREHDGETYVTLGPSPNGNYIWPLEIKVPKLTVGDSDEKRRGVLEEEKRLRDVVMRQSVKWEELPLIVLAGLR
jgi:hypothetical protein